jgi:transposase
MAAVNEGELHQAEILRIFKINRSGFNSFIKHVKETGCIERRRFGTGRPSKFGKKDIERIKRFLATHSDAMLQEILDYTGKDASIMSVHRTLKKIGYKLKKSLFASEQERKDVKAKRVAWQRKMKSFIIEKLVFIDESGVQKSMTRRYGRILGGERLREAAPGGHWDSTTMISSIRLSGEIAALTIKGATDALAFQAYVTNLLCPTLGRGDVVIMDNLSSHKVAGIREAIEATGATLLYLPPYSPDFNPIEMMWSKIKAYLRKAKARTAAPPDDAVSRLFDTITASDINAWFTSCGYVLIQS